MVVVVTADDPLPHTVTEVVAAAGAILDHDLALILLVSIDMSSVDLLRGYLSIIFIK